MPLYFLLAWVISAPQALVQDLLHSTGLVARQLTRQRPVVVSQDPLDPFVVDRLAQNGPLAPPRSIDSRNRMLPQNRAELRFESFFLWPGPSLLTPVPSFLG